MAHWRSPVLVLAALVTVAGCASRRPPARMRAAVGARQELAGETGCSFTKAGRLAAMISVHAHARHPDRHFPPGFHPMDIRTAAICLRDDPDPMAKSRRRRAIAKLVAYVGRSPEWSTTSEPIVEILLADQRALMTDLENAVEANVHLTAVQLEAVITDRLRVALEVAGCDWDPDPPKGDVTCDGGTILANASFKMQKGMLDIARNVDPQSWDDCGTYWTATYLALKDAMGAYPLQAGGCYAMQGPAVWPGTPYNDPAIFESFECSSCSSSFQNLLDVTTEYCQAYCPPPAACCTAPAATASKYHVHYDLHGGQSLCSTVAGTSVPVVIDGGDVWVINMSTNQSDVESNKTLGFGSKTANKVGCATLQILMDEAKGEVPELACCLKAGGGIPPPPPLPPPHLTGVAPLP